MSIIKAAIMYSNGEIVEGRTYSQIDRLANSLGIWGDKIEGFVTSSGEFTLPVEAAVIAINAGQVKPGVTRLLPEHLYVVETVLD